MTPKAQNSPTQGSDTLWANYQDYKKINESYLKELAVDGQYYIGNHYTPAELRQLKKRGQAPSVVNYCFSTVFTQMSIMGAKSPTFRTVPKDDNDVKFSKLLSDVLAHIYHISDGDMETRDAMENMLVFGRGHLHGYWDPYSDFGRGDIKFESVPVDEVYWDPKSRKRYGQDSEYVFRKKSIPQKVALKHYPQYKNIINSARQADQDGSIMNPNPSIMGATWGTGNIANPAKRTNIDLIDAYGKRSEKVYSIFSEGKLVERDLSMEEAMQKYQHYVQNGMKIDGVFEYIKESVEHHLMFGPYVAFSEVMPIPDYPIVPLINHFTGNMFPFGEVRQIRPLNDEINRMRSLRILNMASAPHNKVIYRRGVFTNEKNVETDLARPGTALAADSAADDLKKDILTLNSNPIQNGNFEHEQATSHNVQQISGVYEMQQGGSASAPETFRGILAFDEFGQRKMKYKLKNVEHSIAHFGKVILRLAQERMTQEKALRIVQPEFNSEKEAMRYQKINVPILDDYGEVIGKFNDISKAEADVVVMGGSTMPTNRWAEQQAYREDYQMGLIDDIEYLKKANIYDREGLLERKSIYSQQKGQIDQLVQQVEELSKSLQKAEKDNKSLNADREIAAIRAELKQVMTELKEREKADTKIKLSELDQKIDEVEQEASLEMKQNKRDLALAKREAKLKQQTKQKQK